MVAQLTPFAPPPVVSQRSQRYWNVNGVVPDHVPFDVVSVVPWTAEPEIFGELVFVGAVCGEAAPPEGTSSAAATTSSGTPAAGERNGFAPCVLAA